MSDLQTESMCIVESRELWAAFKSEARTHHISTAAGLREMLADKYVQARRNSDEFNPDKQAESRSKVSIKSLTNAFDMNKEVKQDDARLDSSYSSFHEHDYSRAIRGKTNSVLSLYKHMDDANNNSHGDSIRRSLSDFTERWIMGDRNRQSVDEESTVNSLRSSATLQLEDLIDTSVKSLEMYENSMKSLEDIATAASSHMLSKSEHAKLDNEEILTYLTMNIPSYQDKEDSSVKDARKCDYEEAMKSFDIHDSDGSDYEEDGAKLFTVKTIRALREKEIVPYNSGNDSYDDRSNNGHFEFPIESKPSYYVSGEINALQPDISLPRRSAKIPPSGSTSADTHAFDSTSINVSLSKSIGSDLLVDWPSRSRPSIKACESKAASSNVAKPTSKSPATSSMCQPRPHLSTTNNEPITSLSRQFMNLKYDLSPAKLPENYLRRASISSLHDDLQPRSRPSPSDVSVSTCPTVLSPPSDISSLLVEWDDTVVSDDEDDTCR